MPSDFMNTKEVASYLDIHEKQVYLLVKAGKIPCTRVTGKWIFPVKLVDEWIEASAMDGLRQARKKIGQIDSALLAAGSNDPVVDMLLTATMKAHPVFHIFSANTGSMQGLAALNSGQTDLALSHLYDAATSQYNIPFLAECLPNINPVVVNLFSREIGFIFSKSKDGSVKGFESLKAKNIRFVNRQKGSGIRLLLDHHLNNHGIDSTKIQGYENEVYTHFEVGLAIVSGDADIGIASAAISKLLGLSFLTITSEFFDMILDQSTFFHSGVQSFIEILKSDAFRGRVEKIGGYDFKYSGKILYSNH